MKAFLAIDLPDDVCKSIEEQIQPFKKDYLDMSWASPNNFHITLQFLGDIYDVESVKKKVEDAIFEVPPFTLFSQGTNLFLGDRIVIYLEFYRQKVLEGMMDSFQKIFNPGAKKPILPHLTLARYRVPSKQQYLHIKKKIHNLSVEVEFTVNKIYLYESILSGPHPEYKKLGEFILSE